MRKNVVIAVLAIGIVSSCYIRKIPIYLRSAHHVNSEFNMRQVSESLEKYHKKYGKYPVFQNFGEMVGAESVLITEKYLEKPIGTIDSWGQPYCAKSSEYGFFIEYKGHPKYQYEFPSLIIRSEK